MRASVLAAFPRFTTRFEGRLSYMYTDNKGLVTTAIGNLIDPIAAALGLPWKRNSDGGLATQDEITQEWHTVKDAWPGVQSVATKSITQLHLDDADIDALVQNKAHLNDEMLRNRFTDFDNLPADAQLGIHSMAWAMGPAFNFPKFIAAVNAKDFATAAKESHMNDSGNPGLVPRNAANVTLFNNAAAVQAAGGDPDILYYPAAVPMGGVPPMGPNKYLVAGAVIAGVLVLGGVTYYLVKGASA